MLRSSFVPRKQEIEKANAVPVREALSDEFAAASAVDGSHGG